MAASVRLCRAELRHLPTSAVPWQTEHQPRIFGDLAAAEVNQAADRIPQPTYLYRMTMGEDLRKHHEQRYI